MGRSLGLLSVPLLAAALAACGSTGDGASPTRFADIEVADDEAALAGRVLALDGEPVVSLPVAACSDVDCPFQQTNAEGLFVHGKLTPLPRRFEIFGSYDEYGSVAFRRELSPGELVDVGDVTLPPVQGPPQPWDAVEGGTVTLAGGALELTAAPGAEDDEALLYPLGTTRFEVQAGRLPGEHIPPFYDQPWAGKEARTLAFSLVPFDLHAARPVEARILDGVTEPPGAVYDAYDVNPLDGRLEAAGTATVDADGVLVTDPDADLRDLTFFLFVPRD